MTSLKYISLTLFIPLFMACGNSKEIEQVEEEVETVVEEATEATMRTLGHVRLLDNDCELYIDAVGEDGHFKIYPTNLDPRFKNEGMHLKFFYQPVDEVAHEDCDVDVVATLSEVTPLR